MRTKYRSGDDAHVASKTIREALRHLSLARGLLTGAGAKETRDRVASAMASARGAMNHARTVGLALERRNP
mgnify:CR=1 FL=1